MLKQTFIEKIFGAATGRLVFRRPNFILMYEIPAFIKDVAGNTKRSRILGLLRHPGIFILNHFKSYKVPFRRKSGLNSKSDSYPAKNKFFSRFNAPVFFNEIYEIFTLTGVVKTDISTLNSVYLPLKSVDFNSRKNLVNSYRAVA